MREMKDSEMPFLDSVPSHWAFKRTKFLVTSLSRGNGIKKDEVFEDGNISCVRYGEIYTEYNQGFTECKSKTNLEVVNTPQYFSYGDILFAGTGELVEEIGKNVVYLGDDLCLAGGDIIVMKHQQEPRYMNYLYNSSIIQAQKSKGKAKLKVVHISPSEIGDIKVYLPPIEEQKGIADYLDEKCAAIDESIQKRKEIIEKLEDYKRATIIHTSLYGLNSKVDFKPTEIPWLKSVPSNWDVLPLRFMFIERKDKNKDGAETNLLSLSYGRIKRKDINSNEGLTPDNYNGYNIVQHGDIVLRLTDLQNDHRSLRTGLVTEKGIITSAYVTLKPLRANTNSSYYRYVLHAYDLMKVFYSMGEGIRQSLKYDDLSRTVLLPVPSEEEQEKIVQYLREKETTIDAMISKQQTIIDKLDEYKKSIIYNAVTGKIDCRPS